MCSHESISKKISRHIQLFMLFQKMAPENTFLFESKFSLNHALKCVFGLLDSVKIREIGTIFTETGQYLKKCLFEFHTLSLTLSRSVRECPNILKTWQITNFDMCLQKKKFQADLKTSFFFSSAIFSRTPT